MDEEIETLKQALTNGTTTDISGVTFYEGDINGQSVVLVRSGIGKVQAGFTTALLVTNFNVNVVINSGSAGGIGKGLHVGDVVLSTQTAYHDVDARAFDYEYGQLPGQPARFDADTGWIAKLKTAAEETGLTVKSGLIVSGDQFIASKTAITEILKHFPDALSSEMEALPWVRLLTSLGCHTWLFGQCQMLVMKTLVLALMTLLLRPVNVLQRCCWRCLKRFNL